MLVPSIIFFVSIFIILLILISIGSKLMQQYKSLSSILMIILGLIIPYTVALILYSKFDDFEYKWFHFIGLLLLVGAMNNGNVKKETSKNAEMSSTFLFFGTMLMSIIMFWII